MRPSTLFLAAMAVAALCRAETNSTLGVVTNRDYRAQVAVPPMSMSVVITNIPTNGSAIGKDLGRMDWLEHRIDTTERKLSDCYEGLKAKVEEKVSAEIKDIENKNREIHEELKHRQDIFLSRLAIAMSIVGIFVAAVGIVLPLFNELNLRRIERVGAQRVQNEVDQYEKLKNDVSEERKLDRERNKRDGLRLKAETYFQLARVGFEQYKAGPTPPSLEMVVKQLSHCVECNVEARDGKSLKAAIALLNTVMNKKPGVDKNHPERTTIPNVIEEHRKTIARNLRSWGWNFKIEDVKSVLVEAGVEGDELMYSISNLETIMRKCAGQEGVL